MKRYRHFVHRLTGNQTPRRVICLDGDIDYRQSAAGPLVQVGALVRWASCGWEENRAGKRRQYSDSGTDASSIWQGVKWCLRQPGVTLCVSWCASRLWAVLGLFRSLEGGYAQGSQSVRADCRCSDEPTVLRSVRPVAGDLRSDSKRNADGNVPLLPVCGTAGRVDCYAEATCHCVAAGPLIIEDPPTLISVRLPGLEGTLQIADLRNWGIDIAPTGDSAATRALWVCGVVTRMIDTVREHEWGSFRYTGGAQASSIWRTKHLTHPVWCHTDEQATAIEAASYYGGRCECYRIGSVGRDVYHFDFRSQYGSICAEHDLPTGLSHHGSGEQSAYNSLLRGGCGLIARVEIETEEAAYPLRRKDGIIYPVGRFWTYLAGPELADAVALGRVRRVSNWSAYNMRPALRAVATDLLAVLSEARTEGDLARCRWLKHMLVALAGRFGQRKIEWRPIRGVRAPAPWHVWPHKGADGVWRRRRSFAWQISECYDCGYAMDANLAVAAWITSEARVRLLRAIRLAGWENLLYCDTDSLITTDEGAERLYAANEIGSGEPGRLRWLGTHKRCVIHGIKHYELDGVEKCSGVPTGRETPDSECGLIWLNSWIKGALHSSNRPEAMRVLSERFRQPKYNLRRVLHDGATLPIVEGKPSWEKG